MKLHSYQFDNGAFVLFTISFSFSLLNLNSPNNLNSTSIFPLFITNRRPSIIVSSSNSNSSVSNDGLSSKDKKLLLEQYGFGPDELLSQSSTAKTKRRKGVVEKKGREDKVPQEEPKLPRTTHKLLQVLAGKARRKQLLSPKGMDVRPMTEVVKGAAFDILQVAGGCPASLRPGRWLGLYSGTGSVGIEAISRGCSEIIQEIHRHEIEIPSRARLEEVATHLTPDEERRYAVAQLPREKSRNTGFVFDSPGYESFFALQQGIYVPQKAWDVVQRASMRKTNVPKKN